MDPAPTDADEADRAKRAVTRPRPGHADLAGNAQVRSRRCARHSRARIRARDDRARRRRRDLSQASLASSESSIGSHIVELGGIDRGRFPMSCPAIINAVADVSPASNARHARRSSRSSRASTKQKKRATRSAESAKSSVAGCPSDLALTFRGIESSMDASARR